MFFSAFIVFESGIIRTNTQQSVYENQNFLYSQIVKFDKKINVLFSITIENLNIFEKILKQKTCFSNHIKKIFYFDHLNV